MLMLWRGMVYLLWGGYVYIDNTTRLPLADWLEGRDAGNLVWQGCGYTTFRAKG